MSNFFQFILSKHFEHASQKKIYLRPVLVLNYAGKTVKFSYQLLITTQFNIVNWYDTQKHYFTISVLTNYLLCYKNSIGNIPEPFLPFETNQINSVAIEQSLVLNFKRSV